MQFNYAENEWGLDICLTPETPEETAALARFTMNSKSVKPDIYMSFSNNPQMTIAMPKVAKHLQHNSLSNSNK